MERNGAVGSHVVLPMGKPPLLTEETSMAHAPAGESNWPPCNTKGWRPMGRTVSKRP